MDLVLVWENEYELNDFTQSITTTKINAMWYKAERTHVHLFVLHCTTTHLEIQVHLSAYIKRAMVASHIAVKPVVTSQLMYN